MKYVIDKAPTKPHRITIAVPEDDFRRFKKLRKSLEISVSQMFSIMLDVTENTEFEKEA